MFDAKEIDYVRDGMRRMVADQLSRSLLTQEGAELISRVIDAPMADANDGLEVGQISMPLHGGAALQRLFVIRGHDQYILYVPEQPQSPGDRIFYQNYDWRRTCHVLGGFLGKPGGLAYMLDLIPEPQRSGVEGYFEEVSRLPSSWNERAMVLMPVAGETYLHQIQKIVNR